MGRKLNKDKSKNQKQLNLTTQSSLGEEGLNQHSSKSECRCRNKDDKGRGRKIDTAMKFSSVVINLLILIVAAYGVYVTRDIFNKGNEINEKRFVIENTPYLNITKVTPVNIFKAGELNQIDIEIANIGSYPVKIKLSGFKGFFVKNKKPDRTFEEYPDSVLLASDLMYLSKEFPMTKRIRAVIPKEWEEYMKSNSDFISIGRIVYYNPVTGYDRNFDFVMRVNIWEQDNFVMEIIENYDTSKSR